MSGLVIANTKHAKQFLKIWEKLDPAKAGGIVCMNPASALATSFDDLEATAKYFCTGLGKTIDTDIVEDEDGEREVKYYLTTYRYYRGVFAMIRANVPDIREVDPTDMIQFYEYRQQAATRGLVNKIRKLAFEKRLTNVEAYMGFQGSGIVVVGQDVTEEVRGDLETAGKLESKECALWWEDHGLKDFYEERLEGMKRSEERKKASLLPQKSLPQEASSTPEQPTSSEQPTEES